MPPGRLAVLLSWLLLSLLLSACAAQPASPPTPSAAPIPTSLPEDASAPPADATATPEARTFAAGSSVAGVDIGGLTANEARERLETELAALDEPLTVQVGEQRSELLPAHLGLAVDIPAALEQAKARPAEALTLTVRLDEAALQDELAALARATALSPTLAVISETDTYSRSLGYQPGARINPAAAAAQVAALLADPTAPRTLTLERQPDLAPPRVDFATLQPWIAQRGDAWETAFWLGRAWEGTLLAYVLHDLESGERLTQYEETVFSGASVLKVAILLHAFVALPEMTDEQRGWMEAMILESDNLAANDLLAASVGGEGTDAALDGVLAMNTTLEALGFEQTFQRLPYEASDYLLGIVGYQPEFAPEFAGEPPYTRADQLVRTTPAEISRLFLMIEDCRQGNGLLLDTFETLSPTRCQELLDVLARNEDTTRMVAGLPPGVRAEHKSGWTENMQGDVGIVRTDQGDFLLAVYVFLDTDNLADAWATPVLADVTRLVYTAYNPVNLDTLSDERRATLDILPLPLPLPQEGSPE